MKFLGLRAPSLHLKRKRFPIRVYYLTILSMLQINLADMHRQFICMCPLSTFHFGLNSCNHVSSFALCSFIYKSFIFTNGHLKIHFYEIVIIKFLTLWYLYKKHSLKHGTQGLIKLFVNVMRLCRCSFEKPLQLLLNKGTNVYRVNLVSYDLFWTAL